MVDLAKFVKENFVDPELEETHQVFGAVRVLQRGTEMQFLDDLRHAVQGSIEGARLRLQLGPAEIRSVDVRHSERTERHKMTDPITKEVLECEETWHDFALTFRCSGNPNRRPLAAVLAKFDEWLLVDDTRYVECGMRVDTPAGVRQVVVINPVHNMIKLNASAGHGSFPLEPAGEGMSKEVTDGL